jgi:diguanylate cyclase (GGDEF)-like protein
MFNLLDIFTLGICSILASSSFGTVFFALWKRRPSERHLLHWAMSNWVYAVVLLGLGFLHNVAVSLLLFVLMGLSDVLVVSGVNRLDAEQPFRRWMLIPLVAPAIGYALPLIFGAADSALADISEAIGLAMAMGSCGLAVLRERPTYAASRGRRLAGLALMAYVVGYAVVIALRIWKPGLSELLPRIPMLLDQVLLGALNLGLLAIPTERAHQRLREAASRDPLTGLWNRNGIQELAPRLIQPGGAVIAIDIDHFKQINDRYGHAAGDKVLVVRGAAFRIGGDELVVIAPLCSAREGEAIANIVRQYCKADSSLPEWTISVGVTLLSEAGLTIEDAIRQADTALYEAKARGRDQVYIRAA